MDVALEVLTYLALLSVAAERFTEIVKRLWLSKISSNGAVYQLMAALFGGFVAYIDPPHFPRVELGLYVQTVLVALAVSGGSGAWNSILGVLQDYAKSTKPS